MCITRPYQPEKDGQTDSKKGFAPWAAALKGGGGVERPRRIHDSLPPKRQLVQLRAYPDHSRGPRDESHRPEPEAERARLSGRDPPGSDNEGSGPVPPSPSGREPKSRPATWLVGHVSIS
jgi:hypothetical protein